MPRRGRTPAKTLDFRPSIPREEFDAVREYVNEFNALGPAATYAYVCKAGQRVRRKRFQVLRKWLHIIRNQYKWFLCSDLGHPGLDYSPEQHLKNTIPSEGRRVAAAIQKVQAAREVLCTLDERFKDLDAIDEFLCLSRQQQAANNTKEQFATSPDLKNELLNAIMSALVGLIRFRGHVPKGGYDVHDAQDDEVPATTPAV